MNRRLFVLLLSFLLLSAAAGLFLVQPRAAAQDDGRYPTPDETNMPAPLPPPSAPGALPEMAGGEVPERPLVFSQAKVPEANGTDAATAPLIDVWYGSPQTFGQLGNPQQWVNILGNVSGLGSGGTLEYALNGGPYQPLSVGHDIYRLPGEGDFNVEIDYADLNNGANEVIIRASDGSVETVVPVSINYSAAQTWPSNYTADWTASANIQDIAQVVDGHWKIDGAAVYIDEAAWGYDRLLAIGDESWTDYEVTVPLTVYALDPTGYKGVSNGPAVGLLLRWLGHTEQTAGQQPNLGWERTGAIGWYRWNTDLTESLQLRGYGWRLGSDSSTVLEFGTEYMLKMSVESVPDQPGYYRLKFWAASDTEPLDWDLQGFSDTSATSSGSLLLIAHHVQARFGQVTIKNLSESAYTVQVVVEGEGSVQKEPDKPEYASGEELTLTAVPAADHEFAGWQGDATGLQNPTTLVIDSDKVVTATFQAMTLTTTVPLSAGWNMVSSPLLPSNQDLQAVFAAVNDQLYLVKNGNGKVFWPAQGINDIGGWEAAAGYQVYMNGPAPLVIEGTRTDPATPIDLPTGWSLIGYLPEGAMPAPQALGSIVSELTLAKDGWGNVYWPAFNVNSIGDMEPGAAYQLYLQQAGILTYPP